MGLKQSKQLISLAAARERLGAQYGVTPLGVELLFAELLQLQQDQRPGASAKTPGDASAPLQHVPGSSPFPDHLSASQSTSTGAGVKADVNKTRKDALTKGEEPRVTADTLRAHLPLVEPIFSLGEQISDEIGRVFGAGGRDGLTLEQFTCMLALLIGPQEDELEKLVFCMFDTSETGFLRKKEFRAMLSNINIGNDAKVPGNFEEDFGELFRVATDAGIALYDINRDQKLSFEEWKAFAAQDESISRCLERLREGQEKQLLCTRMRTLSKQASADTIS